LKALRNEGFVVAVSDLAFAILSPILGSAARLGIIACLLVLVSGILAALIPAVGRLIQRLNPSEYHDDPKKFADAILMWVYFGLVWAILLVGLILALAGLLHCFMSRSRPRMLFPLLALPLVALVWLLIGAMWEK
jgi:hypothetical protein